MGKNASKLKKRKRSQKDIKTEGSETKKSDTSATRIAITMNIPRFYKPDPAIFFLNIESQFTLAGIVSEQERFVHLTAKLEPEILAEVPEIIRDPAAHEYSTIKAALIKRFAQSEEHRLNTLLGDLQLGDRTPSAFLREIQRLAGDNVPESLVRGLWLNKLPGSTQQILQAISLSTSLAQQAEIADKVVAVHPTSFHSVAASSPTSTLVDQVAELTKQMALLTQQVNAMASRSRSSSRSSPHHRSSSAKPLCRIHYKYGDLARSCLSPNTCTFKPKGNE
ncbi:hypothetical protein WDU94_002713 [Cyamophila willieti]